MQQRPPRQRLSSNALVSDFSGPTCCWDSGTPAGLRLPIPPVEYKGDYAPFEMRIPTEVDGGSCQPTLSAKSAERTGRPAILF
jgi:hypothetical protein